MKPTKAWAVVNKLGLICVAHTKDDARFDAWNYYGLREGKFKIIRVEIREVKKKK